jgi:hypothetical protein
MPVSKVPDDLADEMVGSVRSHRRFFICVLFRSR